MEDIDEGDNNSVEKKEERELTVPRDYQLKLGNHSFNKGLKIRTNSNDTPLSINGSKTIRFTKWYNATRNPTFKVENLDGVSIQTFFKWRIVELEKENPSCESDKNYMIQYAQKVSNAKSGIVINTDLTFKFKAVTELKYSKQKKVSHEFKLFDSSRFMISGFFDISKIQALTKDESYNLRRRLSKQ